MAAPSFALFDADNHYYEATDAFTRHLPRELRRRSVQWAEVEGRQRLLVGGSVCNFIPNPTFDPIARPGCLYDYYLGKTTGSINEAFGELEDISAHPEYRDRDARLRTMDEHGVEGCFMFPTLGVGMEEALLGDVDAVVGTFRAFNRWLEEDWGFAYQGRIFTAPYLTLADPDEAVRELAWALEHDARIVILRPAPAPTAAGPRPPGDPMFDAFWDLAATSGVTVAYHSGDAGAHALTARWGVGTSHRSFGLSAFYMLLMLDRPMYETMAALLTGGVLHRRPGLRIVSVEQGSEWVAPLFAKTAKVWRQQPDAFGGEHPHEILRRQLWVSPHFEEDKRVVVDLLGREHVLMGSDWPHAEGLPMPGDYRAELERDGFDDATIQAVMRDNGLPLTVRSPSPILP